jgi:acyl-CoA synthetase (AMP-forming)/AMP-acid ligase II/ankyrin repeat protein
LIWERSNNSRSEIYWEITAFAHLNQTVQNDATIFSISYLQYLEIVICVATQLRCKIKELFNNLSVECTEIHRVYSIPVAVAIPEGPWLPVAVAAVHALNDPFLSSDQSIWISVTLIPLDPADGFERLVHMLREACPALILTASSFDFTRIQQIVDEILTSSSRGNFMLQPIVRFTTTTVLNLCLLIDGQRGALSDVTQLNLRSLVNQCGEREALHDIWRRIVSTFEVAENHCNDLPNGESQISHIVFTSGSTGQPKGCVSSVASLRSYINSKNESHHVTSDSVVLLASAVSFDPCISDVLATFAVRGTLGLARRCDLIHNSGHVLRSLSVTHVLCTPTFWSTVPTELNLSECSYPNLRVIALGGEPIPRPLARAWLSVQNNIKHKCLFQLFATYGVTEACVYQTIGEVNPSTAEHDVGIPFTGMVVRICIESRQDKLIDIAERGFARGLGEVVLAGNQLDNMSAYLLRPTLSDVKFVQEDRVIYYRTGDRGYINERTSHLHVVGRIGGEEGTIKINGVRVELAEIEASLVDEADECNVVEAAIVTITGVGMPSVTTELHAYVVLSKTCLIELGIVNDIPNNGLLCCGSPLFTLLRERCKRKATVTPSVFVIIPCIPMSSTGKRYREGVPPLREAVPIASFLSGQKGYFSIKLRDYGRSGAIVADEICNCLNLQDCQIDVLSTASTFAMAGGDSLTATRIARAIFARHHNIFDSRYIGGEYGILEGPFSALYLLGAENLGVYVDMLDKYGICDSQKSSENIVRVHTATKEPNVKFEFSVADTITLDSKRSYEALLQSTMSRYTNIAMALLDAGADPNLGESKGRLGKVSGRNIRKKLFRSNPLHLACLQGDHILVKKLLEKKAKYNVPNASSQFPLHLAAAGEFHGTSSIDEDERRLRCVEHLLKAGCPLQIRDGSKQTILHAAARAGHIKVLKFALDSWIVQIAHSANKEYSSLDVRDSWSRTPVHWAVLNCKIDALQILIDYGCSASPVNVKRCNQKTSAALESPIEMCNRLYGDDSYIAARIKCILLKDNSA